MSKYTIEEVKRLFGAEKYVLLSNEYINVNTKLKYICSNGHKHQISLKKWLVGQRCPICKGKVVYSLKNIQELFLKEGYSVLSKEYKNTNSIIKYTCPNGHEHTTTLRNWRKGRRCPYCSNKIKKTYKEISESFENEGYVLLADSYINCESKLLYRCPNGHERITTWSVWRKGYRCPECSGTAKLTIDQVKCSVEDASYTLLNTEYFGNHNKLHLMCPNGHDYFVSFANWSSKGYRCPKCSEQGVSKAEKELLDFIRLIYTDKILTNDRQILSPKEVDILLPDLNLAIEYCGVYWHSELAGKTRNYHLNKLDDCKRLGYSLLTVFEDEWLLKNEITKSRIASYINSNNMSTVYARKCIIKELSTKQAKEFCDFNHLQGYGSGSTIRLGAFYEDTLVALMTFSKPSIAKGYRDSKEGCWELHRFCTLLNYRVVGVASKLLKYFEKHYFCNFLFSFADRRWSSGKLYEQLGFTLLYSTSPNYWYFKGSNPKRINRFSLRKGQLNDNLELSEWENRKLQGYNRIWDCGNLKYVKEYK